MYSSRKTPTVPAKVCSTCIGVQCTSVTFNKWQMNQISLPCTAPSRFCFGCALRLLNTLTALKAVNVSIANISSEIRVSAIITAIRRARHTWKACKTCCRHLLAILPTYMQIRICHSENKYVT